MKNLIFFFSALLLFGCGKETLDNTPRIIKTDVLVKVKGDITIDKVFEFINAYPHEVENIQSRVYTSNLPQDSLQYVLDYLNKKPYTNSKGWAVTGYLHYQSKEITIFPRLFEMKNVDFQNDWIKTMKILGLKEQNNSEKSGSIIYFHVPKGEEMEWKNRFEKLDFIEWVELNYYYPNYNMF